MGKRKRIAIFANGWNNEYLKEFGQGAFQCAKVTDTDLFIFTNYSTHGLNEVDNSGEFNIYLLPDLNDFDGAMFLTNSFNLDSELQYLQEQVLSRPSVQNVNWTAPFFLSLTIIPECMNWQLI